MSLVAVLRMRPNVNEFKRIIEITSFKLVKMGIADQDIQGRILYDRPKAKENERNDIR